MTYQNVDLLASRDGDFAVGGPIETVDFCRQRREADCVPHVWNISKLTAHQETVKEDRMRNLVLNDVKQVHPPQVTKLAVLQT